MLKCRLVNREFNAIIQSSTMVQYYLACEAAGVIDNPQSSLSYAERLEALKKREDAWRKLKPVFEMTMDVGRCESWELTAGYYVRGTSQCLYHCQLPSSPQDNVQWFRIPTHGPGQSQPGFMHLFGTAVSEHDLVVNVISSEVGNRADMQRHSLDLVLLKFSTGEYHPLAHHPLIHVQRSPSKQPGATVRILGDHLALVIHDEDGSKLFIFDWKTGHKRLQHKATERAYRFSDPVFVSPEFLLVPNCILSQFEVWHVPSHPNSNPPVQILSLQIPAVSEPYFIASIGCHGELSPFLHSMPYFPSRPFFPSWENSIIIINLHFYSESLPEPVRNRVYKLIMHRRALLDTIHKWTSPSLLEQEEGLSTWFTNELTSELVSMVPHPGSSPRTRDSSSYSSISSGSVSSTSRYNVLQLRWADWGPPISRWIQLYGMAKHVRIDQFNSQRCVFVNPNPRDERKCIVYVADFNLHNVRKNAEMMAQLRGREGEGNGGNSNNGEGKKEESEEELEILDHEGVFSEEVYMGLKCVVYQAPSEYGFDSVMMDDERLFVCKNKTYRILIERIRVLYFG
ncbi:hypothetical protein M378DRAFT_518746 [Amanita muscaria Koide BX008]|uniref:Uncharacterized protein n=1 Tax=Amanita muscaria (strain Koide BX008) TaxID=946122 RepID=A0A0C2X8F5_AMAMK|nr:hypothetical protein M378DRAFT_518746 [Amanita muscaria Koide BX008]